MSSEFYNHEPPISPLEILKAVRGIGMDIFWNRPMQCHADHQCFFQENLAFGKPTMQYNGEPYGGVSSKAVDGNSATIYWDGSCTHTKDTVNPWWRVDLGQVEPVSEVYIVNQVEEWFFRLGNFEIRVGKWLFCQFHSVLERFNRPFYSCLLINLAFAWQRG